MVAEVKMVRTLQQVGDLLTVTAEDIENAITICQIIGEDRLAPDGIYADGLICVDGCDEHDGNEEGCVAAAIGATFNAVYLAYCMTLALDYMWDCSFETKAMVDAVRMWRSDLGLGDSDAVECEELEAAALLADRDLLPFFVLR